MSSRIPAAGAQHDYVARIRYSNPLPPPPNPPKLLELPDRTFGDGYFTSPSFASRLAREQPLNVELDTELGMPIDLVGLPGVFDGDNSVMEADGPPPPVDPRDAPLLMSLEALRKPRVQDGGAVSFLRRTEYTAANTGPRRSTGSASSTSVFMAPQRKSLLQQQKQQQQKQTRSTAPQLDQDRASPAGIKRGIDASFAAAKRFCAGPIKHPSRPRAKLVSTLPLVPDLDSFPDSGAYVTIKFASNPLPKSRSYDVRLSAGILQPIERSAHDESRYMREIDQWEKAGRVGPQPTLSTSYDFFLPNEPQSAINMHRKLDLGNADSNNDEDGGDEGLYTARNSRGEGVFNYLRLRAYETIKERELNHATKYDEELLLAFGDDSSAGGGRRVAHYLPIMQRSTLQSQRSLGPGFTTRMGSQPVARTPADNLEVRLLPPSLDQLEAMQRFRENPFYTPIIEEDEAGQAGQIEPEGAEGVYDAEGEVVTGEIADGEAQDEDEDVVTTHGPDD